MKKINWKYCECGCHGSEFTFGTNDCQLYFWIYLNLNSDRYCLSRYHGRFESNKSNYFSSLKELNLYVYDIVSQTIEELNAQFSKLQ